MPRRILFPVVLLFIVCSQISAETIRVGSWNIEHLGFPDSRFGDAAGIAQQPADLAAHIEDSGVDVLALQEIGDLSDPGQSGTLSMTLVDSLPLNQDGDDVKLINASGEVVHEVSYTSFQVEEGRFITF